MRSISTPTETANRTAPGFSTRTRARMTLGSSKQSLAMSSARASTVKRSADSAWAITFFGDCTIVDAGVDRVSFPSFSNVGIYDDVDKDVLFLFAFPVIEHLDPIHMIYVFQEGHRILKPSGIMVVTTPSAWSNPILKTMARLSLVSKEEIDEHAFAYTMPLLGWCMGRAQFDMRKVKFGYFEFFLNMWSTAEK